jgi:hypothetical protein
MSIFQPLCCAVSQKVDNCRADSDFGENIARSAPSVPSAPRRAAPRPNSVHFGRMNSAQISRCTNSSFLLKTNSRKQILIPRSCLLLMCRTRLHLHDRGSPILVSPIRHLAMAANATSQNLKMGRKSLPGRAILPTRRDIMPPRPIARPFPTTIHFVHR